MITPPAVHTAVQEAFSRTDAVIAQKASEPDHEACIAAMIQLQELCNKILTNQMPAVPYDVIDAGSIDPYSRSWWIFQLFETLQNLVEWLNSENPELTEAGMVLEFNAIASNQRLESDLYDTIFPRLKISPAARRAIRKGHPFTSPSPGYVVEKINGEQRSITITCLGLVMLAELPQNVRLNDAQVWDIVPV